MGLIKLKYITRVRCKQRKRYCAGQSQQKIMNDQNEQPAEIVLSVLQDETSNQISVDRRIKDNRKTLGTRLVDHHREQKFKKGLQCAKIIPNFYLRSFDKFVEIKLAFTGADMEIRKNLPQVHHFGRQFSCAFPDSIKRTACVLVSGNATIKMFLKRGL